MVWVSTAPPAAVWANFIEFPPAPPPCAIVATNGLAPVTVLILTYFWFSPPASATDSTEFAGTVTVSEMVVALARVLPDRVVEAPGVTVSWPMMASGQVRVLVDVHLPVGLRWPLAEALQH